MSEPQTKFNWHNPLFCAIAVLLGVVGMLILNEPAESIGAQAIGWAILLGAVVLLALGIIRWAFLPQQQRLEQKCERIESSLREIREHLSMSEAARRIAFRDRDHEILRNAIKQEINRGKFETALHLIEQIDSAEFAIRIDLDQMRSEIDAGRKTQVEKQIDERLTQFNQWLERHEWERAARDANKIAKEFGDQPETRNLIEQVKMARQAYKDELERQFLEAAQRNEVNLGMDLMKELDKYLTEKEAEPFREAARGVITKKRENLAVQFKLAVHDKAWAEAVRIGEEIMTDFANSKMAEEVHCMIDVLRQHAVTVHQSES